MYGLMAIPFNGHMVTRLRAWFHRNLRAVVNMPATSDKNRQQGNHGDAAIGGQGVIEHWQTLQQQRSHCGSNGN